MKPLAERLRPKTLEDWVGQSDLLAPDSVLRRAIETDQIFSFILYAPPGSGKTSLCRIIQAQTKKRFVAINAVTSGVKDLKVIIEEAKLWKDRSQRETVLFIDEIHRFNKSQQDALLAAVERGDLILLGATTENPSFEINAALLSRARVFRMEALSEEDLLHILQRAKKLLEEEKGTTAEISDEDLRLLAKEAHGDARVAIGAFEVLFPDLSLSRIQKFFARPQLSHDKSGDLHYQIISAFIKSMRAGQTDAALYYLARLWEAGEDPKFIARRMLIFASEDVGNADLRAIALANAVKGAVEFIGRPECFYALSQGVIYLSKAAKSREAGDRFQKALAQVRRSGPVSPPRFLINAVTKLDKELGRGAKALPGESFFPPGFQDLD